MDEGQQSGGGLGGAPRAASTTFDVPLMHCWYFLLDHTASLTLQKGKDKMSTASRHSKRVNGRSIGVVDATTTDQPVFC